MMFGLCRPTETVAANIDIEFLQTQIDLKSISDLYGLACRNYDHIVHLDISVDWSRPSTEVETSGYKRLIFWTDPREPEAAEYLFPKETYFYLHGAYIIKGYFIVRSGGMHQGVLSIAFEKINDAMVMLNPSVRETRTASARCP